MKSTILFFQIVQEEQKNFIKQKFIKYQLSKIIDIDFDWKKYFLREPRDEIFRAPIIVTIKFNILHYKSIKVLKNKY